MQRYTAEAKEEDLARKLEDADGHWDWHVEYRRRYAVLKVRGCVHAQRS
jgi:hypothetical protein